MEPLNKKDSKNYQDQESQQSNSPQQYTEETSTIETIKRLKSPKDIIKSLINLGAIREDFQIFGHTWTFRALNQSDLIAITKETDITQAALKVHSIVVLQIAYSLDACDGIPVTEWFKDSVSPEKFSNPKEYEEACRLELVKYLEKLSPDVLAQFTEAYLKLDEKRKELFEQLKNF